MSQEKIILDLCGGTGSWSRPYAEAGYDVRVITLPDHDVATYKPPNGVYGILAAPPCTMFSIARMTAKTPRDFEKGMETILACLKIIWKCQGNGEYPALKFWALENPGSGFLKNFLGKPAHSFQPMMYGDKYTKLTSLWGFFKTPQPKPVRMEFGDDFASLGRDKGAEKEIPEGYKMPPDMTPRQVRRSITPSGFAQAFFESNQ